MNEHFAHLAQRHRQHCNSSDWHRPEQRQQEPPEWAQALNLLALSIAVAGPIMPIMRTTFGAGRLHSKHHADHPDHYLPQVSFEEEESPPVPRASPPLPGAVSYQYMGNPPSHLAALERSLPSPPLQSYQPGHRPGSEGNRGFSNAAEAGTGAFPFASPHCLKNFDASHVDPRKLRQLEKLGLKAQDQIDRIVLMLSMSEGNPQSINWNDNGSGVSVGLYQANQKGDLAGLFNAMYRADPLRFKSIFKENTAALLDATRLAQLRFSRDNRLGTELQQALQIPAFQRVELERARQRVGHFCQLARTKYGVTSPDGLALYNYLMNWGPALANRYFSGASSVADQNAKIQAILHAACHDIEARHRMQATLLRAQGIGLD